MLVSQQKQEVSVKRASVFEGLFYLFVFFPYLALLPVPTDTQPNALVLSSIYVIFCLMVKRVTFPPLFLLLLSVVMFSTVLVAASGFSFTAFRSYLGYVSIFIVSAATYFFTRIHGFSERALRIIIWVWLFGGLLQYAISPNILSPIVGGVSQRIGLAGGRGVSSFAVEPTYYGTICFLLLFIVLYKFKTKKLFYSLVLVFQILFLAQSSLVILVLLINLFFAAIVLKRFKLIVLVLILFLILIGPLSTPLEQSNSRVSYFVRMVRAHGVLSIFYLDASANQRMSHIYYSFFGFIEDIGVPHGFTNWSEFYMRNVHMSYYFWYPSYYPERIMSAFGGVLFELGWIGLIIPLLLNYLLLKAIWKTTKRLILGLGLNLILLTAVPLTLPLIGFIVGLLVFDIESSRKVFLEP